MILFLGQKVILSVLLEKLNAKLSESTFIAWQGAEEKGILEESKKRNQGRPCVFQWEVFTFIVKREGARGYG